MQATDPRSRVLGEVSPYGTYWHLMALPDRTRKVEKFSNAGRLQDSLSSLRSCPANRARVTTIQAGFSRAREFALRQLRSRDGLSAARVAGPRISAGSGWQCDAPRRSSRLSPDSRPAQPESVVNCSNGDCATGSMGAFVSFGSALPRFSVCYSFPSESCAFSDRLDDPLPKAAARSSSRRFLLARGRLTPIGEVLGRRPVSPLRCSDRAHLYCRRSAPQTQEIGSVQGGDDSDRPECIGVRRDVGGRSTRRPLPST